MSDAALTDVQPRAQAALAASPIYDLRVLHVEQVREGLLISGSVSSYYHKQLAQEIVGQLAGAVAVVNRVDVE